MSKTNASETCSARIPELFGSMVFNDHVMKERLPKGTYQAPVSYTHLGASLYSAWISPQAHRASFRHISLLIRHQVDDSVDAVRDRCV